MNARIYISLRELRRYRPADDENVKGVKTIIFASVPAYLAMHEPNFPSAAWPKLLFRKRLPTPFPNLDNPPTEVSGRAERGGVDGAVIRGDWAVEGGGGRAQKKALSQALEVRRGWIESEHRELSIVEQCALAGLARSTYYYEAVQESAENLKLMRVIEELYLKRPFYGSPRMSGWLSELGWVVNEKRVARLMRVMGLQASVPGPHTSRRHPEHRVYPYLLRDLEVQRPNQVWCSDITYVPMRRGFLYLVVVMDWYSRYVLAWELSNTLEVVFCVEALQRALGMGCPEIFNTDQGAQFTSEEFTGKLQGAGIRISMDGRGRALDNVMVERLWRSVKYEDIYLWNYADDGSEAWRGLNRYFPFYNTERRHQGLGSKTPAQVYVESSTNRQPVSRNRKLGRLES